MASTETTLPALLDAFVRVSRLPGEGRQIAVSADAEARKALAERLKIPAVEVFSAALEARPVRGGLRVTGEIKAEVVQECVVTFEPVPQSIEAQVDRVFLRGSEPDRNEKHHETFVDPDAEDEPDWFEGDKLDLSPLLVETLSLALDPYPRAPGAELPENARDDEGATDSPFARLESLKQRETP